MPLRHPPFRLWVLYPLMLVVSSMLLRVFGRYRVRNKSKVPRRGGLIVLSNHISDADVLLVQLATPRPVHFMAKSELFDMAGIGPLIRWYGAFPVRRGTADRAAIKHAVALAQNGEVVGIFPEGQLSESGELQDLKPGIALIIRLAQVPVICLGIRGMNRVLPYGSYMLRPTGTKVRAEWGEPRQFPPESTNEEILDWTRDQLLSLSRA